jgi:UDP-2-acetamido-2-deoxy-ribo-hexuluronate aminotransferase
VYAQYTVRTAERDQLASKLGRQNVPTAIYYPKCLHHQPVFAAFAGDRSLPQSESAAAEVLSLPMHPYLSEADQDRVVDAIAAALA